jgi:putative transposase
MKKGNVYRIYPNREQCSLLEQHFGAVRFIYNRSLFIKNLMYGKFGISLTEVDLNNNLIVLKDHFAWLNYINSQ